MATHVAVLIVVYVLLAVGGWHLFVEGCRAYGRRRRRRSHPPVPSGFTYGRHVRIVREEPKPYEWTRDER
jgi:hypothetical protein